MNNFDFISFINDPFTKKELTNKKFDKELHKWVPMTIVRNKDQNPEQYYISYISFSKPKIINFSEQEENNNTKFNIVIFSKYEISDQHLKDIDKILESESYQRLLNDNKKITSNEFTTKNGTKTHTYQVNLSYLDFKKDFDAIKKQKLQTPAGSILTSPAKMWIRDPKKIDRYYLCDDNITELIGDFNHFVQKDQSKQDQLIQVIDNEFHIHYYPKEWFDFNTINLTNFTELKELVYEDEDLTYNEVNQLKSILPISKELNL